MIALACGVFGLVIGSFLNVLILRHGERGIGGRSECMSCQRTLTTIDLIPVFSWIALRGKCRTCKCPISMQYPLVEATTGIIFALIGEAFFKGTLGGTLGGALAPFFFSTHSLLIILYFAMAALLIAITVYDLYHMIIPDEWAFLFGGLALLTGFLTNDPSYALTVLLSGPITAAPLYALWLVSRGRWMGLGDPKLALGIGWLLGPTVGIAAVFLAFIIGAIISVGVIIPVSALRAGGEHITMKSEVPFGPFLVVSTFALWLAILYGAEPTLLSLFS